MIVWAVDVTVPSPDEMCEYVDPYWTCDPRYLIEVTSQLALATTISKAFAELALTVKDDVEVVKVTASAQAARKANGKTEENFILRTTGENRLEASECIWASHSLYTKINKPC